MKYHFYQAGKTHFKINNPDYPELKTPEDFYDVLEDVWCEYSCAPRMRKDWSKENRTLGQCSITSFLVQDIFGGEVYGVPLQDGSVHCFNVVEGEMFDLTSEQFGNEELVYTLNYPQNREEHFASEEKYQRYLYLKQEVDRKKKA